MKKPPNTSKVGRNQPCMCGSGQKYKRCCGAPNSNSSQPVQQDAAKSFDIQQVIESNRADQRIREEQQGLGRPIVSAVANGQRVVAVGGVAYYSARWKTFPDFLSDYLKRVLDPEWGNAELAKPLSERHQILQWYDAYCRYQRRTIATPGVVHSVGVTGVVACYLGLAYGLYLLDHNVELQDRLIRRLKDPGNFQGAYYEVIVANILIRAGFLLTLEDETGGPKHCEFSAVSRRTGTRYWIEAKMRGVSGVLGRTDEDGTRDPNPISQLIPHLNAALRKPAPDERLIFIDLNAEVDAYSGATPPWHGPAVARLTRYEQRELRSGVRAYVFVTNMPFHRSLDGRPLCVALPFGLGMGDFNKPGQFRLSDIYRQMQKHKDAHSIEAALTSYLSFPATFDGGLVSEAFGQSLPRIRIGETYILNDEAGRPIVGRVTAATVAEHSREAYIGFDTGHCLRVPMTVQEISDYKTHADAYFGRVEPKPPEPTGLFEMFEWLMEVNKDLPRDKLLGLLSGAQNIAALSQMSDGELLAEHCERMVLAAQASGFHMGGGRVRPMSSPNR